VSTRRKWLALGLLSAGSAAAALLFPIPDAITYAETLPWRTLACLLALGLLVGSGALRSGAPKRWLFGAAVAGSLTAVSLLWYSASNQTCLAQCNSRQYVIGEQLRDYVSSKGGVTNDDLLFDAGCEPTRAWTPASIARCRMVLLFSGFVWIPLGALFGGCLLQASAARYIWPARAARPSSVNEPAGYAYDAFISYRHTEPDQEFARDLLDRLEEAGFKIAFDERDFRPNVPVIDEMERCVVNSKFTLCVVSPRYISSGFCSEEAEVCKTLDMELRSRRLVPLFLERVTLPLWFRSLVGIDFSNSDTAVDPYERIKSLLKG
jgi:hypothetical protein